MKTDDVIRVWKDERYRLRFSESEQALMPQNPAGSVEIADEDLENASGQTGTIIIMLTFLSCVCPTEFLFSCTYALPGCCLPPEGN